MWLLGRLLPQMIGHWIPRENEHWLSYLLLLDIVDILFAPCITVDDVSFLVQWLCGSISSCTCHTKGPLHDSYGTNYEKVSKKTSRLLFLKNRYGPLKHHWTMQYESKHSYFKRLANCLGNYNICHTLSIRHEQLQCYIRMDDSIDMDVGPGRLTLNSYWPLYTCTDTKLSIV